ncbi:MAG: 23S rRNA (pseudouridine(1915)-N(3))-methyltransferase RlmH [Clostridia bacterium]|nr:23S rRNA (pseudouridine(1915)-N(3))-methyltransferase RlmH [Clostridia bacterium]
MKINVVAVGKLKEDYFRLAVAEYSKRINRFAKLTIFETLESKNLQRSEGAIKAAKEEECVEILSYAKGRIIALDSRGSEVTSEEFSDIIKSSQDIGQELTFIIGGSDGLSEKLLKTADKAISFGKVTYPHQLMRVILLEQIYRGFTIIANMPYHK